MAYKTLTARQIIKKEYGGSKNFITPNVISYGKIGRSHAYELSSGKGLEEGTTIYGVSIVKLNPDGTTERDEVFSKSFYSEKEARDYIKDIQNKHFLFGKYPLSATK